MRRDTWIILAAALLVLLVIVRYIAQAQRQVKRIAIKGG